MNPLAKNKGAFTSVLLILLASLHAQAVEAPVPQGKVEICAVLDRFSGDIQVFNADRSGFIEVKPDLGVPCGGWISVDSGFAHLKHRDGFSVQLSSDSFTEIKQSTEGGLKEQVGLYRGAAFFQLAEGSIPVQVSTANAVVAAKTGAFIVNYRKAQDETQLISFSRDTTFANRFLPERTQGVKNGESSSLNFSRVRTTPSLPRAVALSSLREVFAALSVEEKTVTQASQMAKERGERRLASDLKGATAHKSKRKSYERHEKTRHDQALMEHFTNRMVAGVAEGKSILHPDTYTGKPQRSRVEVQDVSPHRKQDDAEKLRLMDELSKIRVD